jgi:chaperone required for assembly of F1-ATPase
MADSARPVKRFWKQVVVVPADGGHGIALDGRPVRTPLRAPLVLTTEAMADAAAAEWDAQGEEVDPRSMPVTGLANAAIDRVAADPATFVTGIAVYGESDLLCYRAAEPPSLAARQLAEWDPLLDWARTRYDIAFVLATGIVHVAQPTATLTRLRDAVAARDPYALAALSPLVTIGGSLVTALALAEGAIGAEAAFDVTHLDELWQVERWGEDALATHARDLRRRDFLNAARFLELAAA